MSIRPKRKRNDGYYDESGYWKRTKFCFKYCGADRCTCQPPNKAYYNPSFNKSLSDLPKKT